MTKEQFLYELRTRLSGLPQQDLEERLHFYSEMIDDRIEEGYTEEAAVDEIGSVDEVVSQILSDYPLTKIVKEKVKPKRKFKTWEIILIILGSPVWASLLIAALAVVFSLYITLWSVVIALWAATASFAVCALYEMVVSVVYFSAANIPTGLASLGLGLFGIGSSCLLFFGCKAADKGLVVLMKKSFFRIKTLLIGKECDQ